MADRLLPPTPLEEAIALLPELADEEEAVLYVESPLRSRRRSAV